LAWCLARPGGNVTGICGFAESLAPKRFELLREILPRAQRVGWIGDATDSGSQAEQRSIAPLAASRGLTIVFANAANPADVEAAMARLIAERGRCDLCRYIAASVQPESAADRVGKPTTPAGDRLSGAICRCRRAVCLRPSLPDRVRRSVFLADKILKGAKPADIPVEQATLFELAVNVKVARALGIVVPQSFLLRADRVVE